MRHPTQVLTNADEWSPMSPIDPRTADARAELRRHVDGRWVEQRQGARKLSDRELFRSAVELSQPARRPRALQQSLALAEEGMTGRGFPVEFGGGDVGGSIVSFEMLAMGDLSLMVRVGVQFGRRRWCCWITLPASANCCRRRPRVMHCISHRTSWSGRRTTCSARSIRGPRIRATMRFVAAQAVGTVLERSASRGLIQRLLDASGRDEDAEWSDRAQDPFAGTGVVRPAGSAPVDDGRGLRGARADGGRRDAGLMFAALQRAVTVVG